MDEVRRLLGLAWPVVLGQLGLVGMGVVDLLMVGPLGKEATAAVGIGNTLSFGVLILALGASVGLEPLVTHAWGAGHPRSAGTAAARGMVVGLLLSVPIMAVHLFAAPILRALQQPESAIPDAAVFCRIGALSVVPFVGFGVVRTLMQGNGETRPPMWVIAFANLANLVTAYTFVRYLGLGVAGVAWGTTVIRWLMFFALVGIGWPTIRACWPDTPVFDRSELMRVARISLPVSLQVGLEVWAFNCGSFLAGVLGDTEVAAHTAALSAASVAFMVPLGVSSAASIRVGNLVGAGKDWRRPGFLAVGLGASLMTVSAAVFLLFPERVGLLYNQDPEVVLLIAAVLPIAACFQWFDGTQVVSFGVLRGLSDTHTPMLFNIVGYWLIGLPVGALLAFRGGFGLVGIWIGLTLGLAVVSILLVFRLISHARTLGTDAGPVPGR